MTPTSDLSCSRSGGPPPWAASIATEVPGSQCKSSGLDLFLLEVTALPFIHLFNLYCVFPLTFSPFIPPLPTVTTLLPVSLSPFSFFLSPSTLSPPPTLAVICPHFPC